MTFWNKGAKAYWHNYFTSIFINLGDPWLFIIEIIWILNNMFPTKTVCFPCLIAWALVRIRFGIFQLSDFNIESWICVSWHLQIWSYLMIILVYASWVENIVMLLPGLSNTYIKQSLGPSWTLVTCVVNGCGEGGGGVASSCPQLLSPTSYFSDEAVCLIQVQIDSENREVKTSGKPASQNPVLTPISVNL